MNNISFYDLNYIIDVNEKRLEQYSNAYQKNLDKFTNILIIYSAVAVFIVPVIQSIFFSGTKSVSNYICFVLFALPFIYSVIFTVKLLIPVNVAYLIEPKTYYEQYRLEYEAKGHNKDTADSLIKASYIDELEKAVSNNNSIFKKKGLFYYRSLTAGLVSCIPYLFCLAFHFANRIEAVQKVEIVNKEKFSTFSPNLNMSTPANNNATTSKASSSSAATTQLPGVNASAVKPSNPQMVKENFQNQHKKDSGGNSKR